MMFDRGELASLVLIAAGVAVFALYILPHAQIAIAAAEIIFHK
ncbi:hypothetical protein [Rhodopseudomonas sp. B29]|nr:hypothetical protein [Rhodopseudomonas sp. B29]